MVELKSRQSEVKEHYRQLASSYESQSNRTCQQAYSRLVHRFLGGSQRVLELGSGSSDLLDNLASPMSVACDLSLDMLRMRRRHPTIIPVAAAGERLPFPDRRFDGIFLINVLEHVSHVGAVLRECARVLVEGGFLLAVTPNGNWERLLDLAERWSLKIPEGPHEFLSTGRLRSETERCLDVVEHRTFLVFPAGPFVMANLLDRLSFCSAYQGGFFQYMLARKAGLENREPQAETD
jgi:SAM-dependent methyltransferase